MTIASAQIVNATRRMQLTLRFGPYMRPSTPIKSWVKPKPHSHEDTLKFPAPQGKEQGNSRLWPALVKFARGIWLAPRNIDKAHAHPTLSAEFFVTIHYGTEREITARNRSNR
jgi:hypothetical protein